MFNLGIFNKLWAYLMQLGYSYGNFITSLSTYVKPLSLQPSFTPPEMQVPVIREKWYYPSEIAHDLDGINLPQRAKDEVYACAWEYTRCVIPQYTNWNRYIAFMRIVVMGIIAEYKGDMIDVTAGGMVLNYNLSDVLETLFKGTPGHADMAREARCFLLITADKSSTRRDGLLFRRYVAAIAKSPQQWYRMRDTDGLVRFTIAASLACSDLDNIWYTEKQFQMLGELSSTLYDSVAFFKHRSEGETNSTFAYVPPSFRIPAYHQCRELLWALDVAWAGKPEHQAVINFVRNFGGPIHMTMRRYRFVEDGMMIGRPETQTIIKQTREHRKLWNRVELKHASVQDIQRYQSVTAREEELLFAGLRTFLDKSVDKHCPECAYDTAGTYAFGGVKLCAGCSTVWGKSVEGFRERFSNVFPEIGGEMMG